jgi:hypothetical protein
MLASLFELVWQWVSLPQHHLAPSGIFINILGVVQVHFGQEAAPWWAWQAKEHSLLLVNRQVHCRGDGISQCVC